MTSISAESFCFYDDPKPNVTVSYPNIEPDGKYIWNEISDRVNDLIENNGFVDEEYSEVDLDILYSSLEFMRALKEKDNFPAPSRFIVSPVGSVIFEWNINNIYIEAEIDEPENVEWMIKLPDEKFLHFLKRINIQHSNNSTLSDEISSPSSWANEIDTTIS